MIGVAIEAAVRPEYERTLRAFDGWVERAGGVPDVFPLWSVRSMSPDGEHWGLDTKLVAALRERGTEPMVYVESTDAAYPSILAKRHDDQLRILACKAAGLVVRWDQEPDNGFGQDWYGDPLYRDVFQHVAGLLHEDGIRMFWCPSNPQSALSTYPGDAADIVGFDRYRWTAASNHPTVQWASPIKRLGQIAPGKPIRVGECGNAAGIGGGVRYLREAAAAPVEAVVLMDMEVPSHDHDWSWTPHMYRAFPGLAA